MVAAAGRVVAGWALEYPEERAGGGLLMTRCGVTAKGEKQGQHECSGILELPGETMGRVRGGGRDQEAALHTSDLKCQAWVQGEMVSRRLEAGVQVQCGAQCKRLKADQTEWWKEGGVRILPQKNRGRHLSTSPHICTVLPPPTRWQRVLPGMPPCPGPPSWPLVREAAGCPRLTNASCALPGPASWPRAPAPQVRAAAQG